MTTRRARNIFFMLLAAVAQWHCAGSGTPPGTGATTPAPPAVLEVRVAPVAVVDWPVMIPISGSLRSQSNVEIKSEVGGKLITAGFEEGDAVTKGQLMAEIDPVNYQLAHDQASAALAVGEAGLERAQVMLDHSRREMERADNLLRTGGITEKDHQAALTGVRDAETQVKLAEAQREQARATLSVTEKALKDCRIVAPADGEVRRKYLDQGSLLAPGTAVYSLVDNARLELECLLPSYQLADVHLGQRALFTTPTWGERKFEGTVSAINPMVEADNRSVKVIVKIANPGGDLRSGMYARGEIEVRVERRAMVIPRSALMVEQEQSTAGSVFVVGDGRARRRSVRLGGSRQDQLWIQEGISPADQVIIEIGPSLKEGAPVRVAPDRPAREQ